MYFIDEYDTQECKELKAYYKQIISMMSKLHNVLVLAKKKYNKFEIGGKAYK